MPTYAKIPKTERAKQATASGRFAIFGGMLEVGPAFKKLQELDQKGEAIPGHGYIKIAGRKYYYCLYGFVNDESIYS